MSQLKYVSLYQKMDTPLNTKQRYFNTVYMFIIQIIAEVDIDIISSCRSNVLRNIS